MSIVAFSSVAYVKAINERELAQGADSFGYLQSRQDIIRAVHEGHWPDHSIDGQQVEILADFFRDQATPFTSWNLFAGPLSYHYNEGTRRLINQYPPGVGAMLALFPEGRSIRAWNALSIAVFAFFFLWFVFNRSDFLKLGMAALLSFVAIHTLGTLDGRSYSINLLLMPLAFSLGLWICGPRGSESSRSWVPIVCGVLFGLCVLIRIPAILVAPAFLASERSNRERLWAFCSFVMFGLLPLAVFQYRLTGHFWQTSYGSMDTAGPGLSFLVRNLSYYLIEGGAVPSWLFFVGVAGALGCEFRSKWEVLWVALLTWLVSFVFFITHEVSVPYYMIPGSFAALCCTVFGMLSSKQLVVTQKSYRFAVLFAFLPGLFAVEQSFVFFFRNAHVLEEAQRSGSLMIRADHFASLDLPPELLRPEAWIYGDMTTGSFWYHFRKNAFKIEYTDSQTRKLWFDYMKRRGEPQYLINDQQDMPKVMAEIREMGGSFESIGRVFDYPAFRIRF